MASTFQQQSLIRKVIYVGAIIGLFSGSFLWRRYVLEPQANEMAALETNQGEVQLHAAAVRLALTGFRGLATCILWGNAMEHQKKHEWNELEVVVNSLTTLQPHFITPWMFQSWNLSYNVSVECDRINDKYFYIARGIQLQAEGERQNRDNPTMRYWCGFYTQHKICISDETNVHRSLLQLSCIPPNERDPARFWKVDAQGHRTINLDEFEDFCRQHPQLVRRLQQGLPRGTDQEDKRQFKCATPEAVVQFLADNRQVPSLYVEPKPEPIGSWTKKPDVLLPVYERFPVLPPPVEAPTAANPHPARPELSQEAKESGRWQAVPFDVGGMTYESPLKDSLDGYTVARAWYGYSQEPIPPPDPIAANDTMPPVDRVRQRLPKYMMTVLFRHYPARAQSYVGERMQQEGWFDGKGWAVPNWFGDKTVLIGTGPDQDSQTAWQQAALMWERHGTDNHLLFKISQDEINTRQLALEFAKLFKITPWSQAPPMRPEDVPPGLDRDQTLEKYNAYRTMQGYYSMRATSNFAHHYERARVESEEDTVTARKLFHRAEALRLTADLGEALDIYEGKAEDKQTGAIALWKKVLLAHKEFRRDAEVQEQTYEVQLRYLELVNDRLKLQVAQLQPYVPQLPKTSGDAFTNWILTKGPFDVETTFTEVDEQGKTVEKTEPLISPDVIKSVQARKHPGQQTPPSNPPGQPGQPPPPGGERPKP